MTKRTALEALLDDRQSELALLDRLGDQAERRRRAAETATANLRATERAIEETKERIAALDGAIGSLEGKKEETDAAS